MAQKSSKKAAQVALAVIGAIMGTAIIVVLIAAALSPEAHATGAEFPWRHFGAAPYAPSRSEAMRTRESAFRELGLPGPVVKLLREATKKPGREVRLTNGTHLSAMLSRGSVVHRNVVVAFVKPPISGKMEYAAPAEKWQVSWQGEIYTVYLPKICNNWSVRMPQANTCYRIPFDYRHTPGVVWDKRHRVHVSAHLDASENDLEAISTDPCFGVIDAKGFRKPFHRCESCEQGEEYPPARLAHAVGLPGEEPKGVLSFRLQDGVGYVSLPLSWAVRWMLYCVDVGVYPVSISGYEDWQAVSRFDIVRKSEIERTLSIGMLDRTLSGALHY